MKAKKLDVDQPAISQGVDGFEDLFSPSLEPTDRTSVWAEPQLYLLPFCVPQDRVAERFRPIKITETVRIRDEVKQRSFRVNPDPELGLPGSFELEVMTGIYRLADEQLSKLGTVPEYIELGSFNSFLGLLGKPYSGKYVRMVKEGLKRLMATICISEGFFYSKPRDLYIVESFTFISSLEIAGEANFNGARYERTRVKLHEFIRENLNENFRTLIDFDYVRSLKTSIAKPLSLHIAYRIFKNAKSTWEADYTWIAERLAIKVHTDFKRAKDQLKAALDELKSTGLIDSWELSPALRLRFVAGKRLIEMHQKRVARRDAWLEHQEKETVQLTFLAPRTQREAARLAQYDPLATLCVKYQFQGWSPAIASEAKSRGLTENDLRRETASRGHKLS